MTTTHFTTQLFIKERVFMKGVSPKTESWYRQSFRAFDGALESKAAVGDRIMKLRSSGVSPISINTYLRCIRAYMNWSFAEGHRSEPMKLQYIKAEQKVIATLSAAHVKRLLEWKPKKVSERRLHLLIVSPGLKQPQFHRF